MFAFYHSTAITLAFTLGIIYRLQQDIVLVRGSKIVVGLHPYYELCPFSPSFPLLIAPLSSTYE